MTQRSTTGPDHDTRGSEGYDDQADRDEQVQARQQRLEARRRLLQDMAVLPFAKPVAYHGGHDPRGACRNGCSH